MSLCTDVCGIIGGYLDPEDFPERKLPLSEQVESYLKIYEMTEILVADKSGVALDILRYRREDGRKATGSSAARIAEFAVAAGEGNKRKIVDLLNDTQIQKFDLSNETYPWQEPRYIAYSKAIEQAFLKNRPDMIKFLTSQYTFKDMVNTKIVIRTLPARQGRDFHNPRAIRIHQANHVARSKTAVRNELHTQIAEGYVRSSNLEGLIHLFKEDFAPKDHDRSSSRLQNSIFRLEEASPNEEVRKFLLDQLDTSDPI